MVGLRHGKAKVIPVVGNRRAVIVKTTSDAAGPMRERSGSLKLGGKPLAAVLTSGAIGKLKKRAKASAVATDGQVHE